MKKFMDGFNGWALILVLLMLAATFGHAQSHSVTLAWTASSDSTTSDPGTVNVYRATGTCAGTPSFTQIKTAVTPNGPYVDASVGTGRFAYYVTQVNAANLESPASNCIAVVIYPKAPTLNGNPATSELEKMPRFDFEDEIPETEAVYIPHCKQYGDITACDMSGWDVYGTGDKAEQIHLSAETQIRTTPGATLRATKVN